MLTLAVGNAPSSGSTFLADLLDSAPGVLCGPELNLFAVRAHYEDWGRIQRSGFVASPTASCVIPAVRLRRGRLYSYGTNTETMLADARESEGFRQFVERFFARYSALRGRRVSLAVEKSPPNIHCAADYLREFPDGHFVELLRDPAYVVRSLEARGLAAYAARATWIVDVAAAQLLRSHPRFHTIRYEQLVSDPFGTVVALLSRLGVPVDERDLADRFAGNEYRATYSTKSIESWKIRDSRRVGNANAVPLGPPDAAALAWMSRQSVSPRYAARYGLPAASFRELLEATGYSDAVASTILRVGEGVADSVRADLTTWRPLVASALLEASLGRVSGRRWAWPCLPLSDM